MTSVWRAEILGRTWLSAKAFELQISRPSGFTFVAGQFLTIEFNKTTRDYSLTSAPSDPMLSLCIQTVQGGAVSSPLAALAVGSTVRFTGPHGYFRFHQSSRDAVLVATGTGIAPFAAMVRTGLRGFVLLHGVKQPNELYYQAFFKSAARLYVPCLTGNQGEIARLPDAFGGRVTAYVRERLPVQRCDFYVCGRSDMIREMLFAVDERFAGSLVYSEAFF